MEIWAPVNVEGYEHLYEISTKGRLKGLVRNRILKGKLDKDGYVEYVLSNKGESKYMRGHRLVALTFIPNPLNLPIINHKDHTKDNNSVDNLEWTTNCLNIRHYYADPNYKSGEKRPLSSLQDEEMIELVRLYLEEGFSYKQLNQHFNLSTRQDAVGELLSGRKFSEITGITEDIRIADQNDSYFKSDEETVAIIREHLEHGVPRQELKAKHGVTDPWLSEVFSGKTRTRAMSLYLESVNA